MKKLLLSIYLLSCVAVCAQDNSKQDFGFKNVYSHINPHGGYYRPYHINRQKHRHNPYRRYKNGTITGYTPSITSKYYSPSGAFSSYSYDNGLGTKISRFFAKRFGNNYNYAKPGFDNYYNGNYGSNPQNMTNIFDNDNGMGQFDEDFFNTNSSKTGVSVKIID